ncbi:MAG: Nif3-like dinuclear metal center hexameric protein [Thermonemataceae bacterium]
MPIKINQIIQFLETFAPSAYQESYDNAGLLVGQADTTLTGALITLDCTEAVVEEAIARQCNLIIAHHPIVFKGLKRFTGSHYVERTVIKAIQNQVAIYATHTNLDNVIYGVSHHIADRLSLKNIKILAPKKHLLMKLTTFCQPADTAAVLEALYAAGAGHIGNYANCSFRLTGTGTFLPNEAAEPQVGEKGQLTETKEERVEVIFPARLEGKVMQALHEAHPYDEVAYYLHRLENTYQQVGSGVIGTLAQAMDANDFLVYLKDRMELPCIRHTALVKPTVQKVALCGGAGFFLLPKAIQQQADVYITADVKYHDFFEAQDKIILADIGHYESEVFTKDLIASILSQKFTNIAIRLSNINTNHVNYLM